MKAASSSKWNSVLDSEEPEEGVCPIERNKSGQEFEATVFLLSCTVYVGISIHSCSRAQKFYAKLHRAAWEADQPPVMSLNHKGGHLLLWNLGLHPGKEAQKISHCFLEHNIFFKRCRAPEGQGGFGWYGSHKILLWLAQFQNLPRGQKQQH